MKVGTRTEQSAVADRLDPRRLSGHVELQRMSAVDTFNRTIEAEFARRAKAVGLPQKLRTMRQVRV